jgi:CMP-N-acetylneuraminic acid synthetase
MSTVSDLKLLAIIPAKAGSQRVAKKNIIDFWGRPLISYTIEAALASGMFDRIVVSSESEEVLSVAKCFSGVTEIRRPDRLAVDPATVIDVCLHVLDTLQETYDYVFIMLPTTPLRTADDVRNVCRMLKEKGPEAVASVTRLPYPLRFAFTLQEGGEMARAFPRMTKEADSRYVVDNGGIYAVKPKNIRQRELIPEGTLPYIMPFWASVDIDTYEDLDVAKAMYCYFIKGIYGNGI